MPIKNLKAIHSICGQLDIDISKLTDNDLAKLEVVLEVKNKYPSQKIEIKPATLDNGGTVAC